MKLQKILRSNSGFSMVEISVAMGLLGLASLAVMNLSDQVNTSTKRAESMLSKSQFASALGGYLYSATACEELKDMATPFSANQTEMVLKDWKVAGLNDGEQMKEVGSGKKFRNFKLKTLTGALDTSSGLPSVVIDGQPHIKTFLNIRAEVEVKLNPKLHEDDPAGKKSYEYFYNIPVLAAGGKVKFCNEEKTIQETCIAMKGKFENGKCELEKTCNVQGTYAILTCTPSGQTCSTSGGSTSVNPVTGSTSCPAGVTPVQTGTKTWSHIGTCSGKKCSPPTVTDTLSYYACLDCPGMSGGTSGTSGTSGDGGGGGGGGGCFVAGTQIQMFGGELKNIEDVQTGDALVDHRGFEVKVQDLKRYNYQGKIYSINGGPFFFTPNHPFLTVDGWKSLDPKKSMEESPGIVVSTLKVGDILLKKSGHEVLKTLDAKEVNEKVYNFTVSGSHEYIADDYAVHNIK